MSVTIWAVGTNSANRMGPLSTRTLPRTCPYCVFSSTEKKTASSLFESGVFINDLILIC